MIKNYTLSGVSNNIEIGKKGCRVSYSDADDKVSIYNAQSQLCKIDCSKGITANNSIIVDQIDNATLTGDIQGSFSINQNGDITLNANISSVDINTKFNHITTTQTLEINKRYYIENNITVTLPDITTINVGDSVELRNKFGSDVTIEVHDDTVEQIYTDTNSSFSSILADVPSHYTFIFNGSDWEVI